MEGGGELATLVLEVPLRVDVTLDSITEGIYVQGTVEFTSRQTCNRCLTEWEEVDTAAIGQLFSGEPDENGYGLEEGTIDLEGPVRDEILLALPLVPLCRDDCRGLCPTCGSDLNNDPCDGHPVASTSPFAGLADRLKETEGPT